MNDKPVIPINHSMRAWATIATTIGVFVDFMQHALPEIQRSWPDAKWVSPLITLVGFLWMSIQRGMDAQKQAGV